MRNCVLEMLDVIVDAQGAQMLDGIFANLFVFRSLVGRRPQHARRLIFAGMLRHLRRHYLEEGMRIRNVRSALKRLCCILVIMKLHVIDEAQVVIQMPVVRIILNAVLDQLNRALGLSSAVRRFWGEEAGAKLVSNHEMWIEVCGDFKKRRQQVVTGGEVVMPVAEILHGARPINTGHQTVVSEAGALDYFRRTEEQDFIKGRLRTKLVRVMQHHATGSQREDEACTGDDRSFAAVIHSESLPSTQYPVPGAGAHSRHLLLDPWYSVPVLSLLQIPVLEDQDGPAESHCRIEQGVNRVLQNQ